MGVQKQALPDIENAAEAQQAEKNTRLKKVKRILVTAAALIVAVGCVIGVYSVSASNSVLKTDNAKVTAQMYNIMGTSSSKLLEWNIGKGDLVVRDEVLGRQETLPAIVSPIDGTIVKCDATPGMMASPSTQLAVVADTDHMYIGVNIEETEITKIAVGQPVDITIDAYGKKVFSGMVSEIDAATQTYFTSGMTSFSTSGEYTKVKQLIPIKVTIDNPEGLPLMYGMNCFVTIHLQ